MEELGADECLPRRVARASQETLPEPSQQLPLKTPPPPPQPLTDGRAHVCVSLPASLCHPVPKTTRKSFLPLRPRTSTSLSVWGRASSPGAGGLFLRRSCSRVAEGRHSRRRLKKSQSKAIKYNIKNPVFIRKLQSFSERNQQCQRRSLRPATHLNTWRSFSPENKQVFLIGIANQEEGRVAMTCPGL